MRKLIGPLSFVLGVMLVIASCKKGDTGPAGPAGPAGPTGATGPAGTKGDPGTANVIYSPWIDTVTYFFVSDPNTPDTILGNLSVPKLDQNMLDKGEIKVYAKLSTNPTLVVPLPYLEGTGFFIQPYFLLNRIAILSNDNIAGLPLRYVLIPGGTGARTNNTINWNDYNQVKAYLGLKD